MYCMTVSYLKSDEATFDFDYYENSHLVLVQDKFGPLGLKKIILRKDIGSKPGAGNKFFASVDLVFDSIESMKTALATAGADVNDDVANYTNAKVEYSFASLAVVVDG